MISKTLEAASASALHDGDCTSDSSALEAGNVIQSGVTIRTSDGIELAASVYTTTATKSRGVAIIASGVGLLQERYHDYAVYVASKGWTVITFDYRGIGRTGLRQVLKSNSCLRDWGKYDLAACIDWASSSNETQRIVVIAHSVGGQIFAFAPNHRKVEAMIAICSQKGYWKFWDGRRRIGLLGLWYLLPVLVSIFGYLPLQLLGRGADIPGGIAREWGRWGRFKDFVDENGQSLNYEFSRVSSRILAVSFSDDKFFAPRRAVEALNALYHNTEHSHWHLSPEELGCDTVGHSGFFQGTVHLHLLWDRVDSWLERDTNVSNYGHTQQD